MITENRFNLIDEPWIPLADTGLVTLKQLFSDSPCRSLGGSPIEKIALNKLCLAIAQAAATPNDDDEWGRMRPEGLARECLSYLERWHDRFYLFGERPFLQIPAIRSAELKPYGTVSPEVSTGNSTVFFQSSRKGAILSLRHLFPRRDSDSFRKSPQPLNPLARK